MDLERERLLARFRPGRSQPWISRPSLCQRRSTGAMSASSAARSSLRALIVVHRDRWPALRHREGHHLRQRRPGGADRRDAVADPGRPGPRPSQRGSARRSSAARACPCRRGQGATARSEPSTGAVNRTAAPSAVGTRRGPSPSVMSLFIAESGLSSLRREQVGAAPFARSEPSAAKRQMPVPVADARAAVRRTPRSSVAVERPGRPHEDGVRAVGDRRRPRPWRRPRRRSRDRSSRSWSRPRLAVNAIRVPSGDQAGSVLGRRADHERPCLTRRDVDQPQVCVLVVDEARRR